MKRLVLAAALLLTVAPALAVSQAPRLNLEDNVFGRKYVNPKPRPYNLRTDITADTTLYFEILVPDTNGSPGRVDPDSITATLVPAGGTPVPILLAGQAFAAPVAVNGATFMEIRERDLDGDGRGDTADNCPQAVNPGQENGDTDGRGDACDCAPLDGSAFALPGEIAGVTFRADRTVLDWGSEAANSGSGTVYDVARGTLGQWPVGSGPGEVCLESGSTDLTAGDADSPASGAGFYYIVRGRNACGPGTYGFDSSATERATDACP